MTKEEKQLQEIHKKTQAWINERAEYNDNARFRPFGVSLKDRLQVYAFEELANGHREPYLALSNMLKIR